MEHEAKTTKKPLPMFYIESKSNSNNKQIYKIKSLLQCKITFEPPHQKCDIPQCVKLSANIPKAFANLSVSNA